MLRIGIAVNFPGQTIDNALSFEKRKERVEYPQIVIQYCDADVQIVNYN